VFCCRYKPQTVIYVHFTQCSVVTSGEVSTARLGNFFITLTPYKTHDTTRDFSLYLQPPSFFFSFLCLHNCVFIFYVISLLLDYIPLRLSSRIYLTKTYLSVCLFVRPSARPLFRLSVRPSVHPSIQILPTYLPIHIPIHLSTYMPTYIPVYVYQPQPYLLISLCIYVYICPSVYLVTSLKSPRTMIQSRVLQSVASLAPARQSFCPARSCVTRDTKQADGCITIYRHMNINSFPFRYSGPLPYRNQQ
jgi:hypothetical protein